MSITISRPDGSTHFLRFTGTIPFVEAGAGYGEIAGTFGGVPATWAVQFLMGLATTYVQPAGSTGPLDPNYRLPVGAYDDTRGGVAGGVAPHTTVKNRTWAQNTRIYARPLDGKCTMELHPTEWSIDATTGLPVFWLNITVIAVDPEVDIQVEVAQTIGR